MIKKSYPKVLFLTGLSKTLLGVFNMVYLYKSGFDYLDILLWQMVVYATYVWLPPVVGLIGNKIGHKKTMMISGFFFFLTYIYLYFCLDGIISVVIYGLLFGIFGSFYWLSNHYFEFQEFENKKVGKKAGFFLIISQLTTILSSLLSAFVLDHYSIGVLILLSFIIMAVGMIVMLFLPENKKREEINLKKFFVETPKQTLFHISLREASTVINTFFSLYIFIYVKDTYGFVGITNVLLGIAGMIFTYFISKRIDKKRNEYLLLSVVLLCLVYLFKINITSGLILVVIFSEGIVKQFHSSVSNVNYFMLGNHKNNLSFIICYEYFINICRVLILLVGYLMLTNFTKYMYFCIGLMVLSGFVSFVIPKKKNK